MTLGDHLRELRARVLKSTLAILAGSVVGWMYYDEIFNFVAAPMKTVIAEAEARGSVAALTINDVSGAFTLQIKVALIVGVIVACPIWIYQLWRFITPGLHRRERGWMYGFIAVAVPLFLAGVVLAYEILPGALRILYGFTPETVSNLPTVDTYMSFFFRMILVFGVGFLTPLVLVALNIFNILTGRRLLSWWRFIIFGVFIFAAVATPTADPINLMILAAPILVLVAAALAFCFINDRRRARNSDEPDYAAWADDETSPL